MPAVRWTPSPDRLFAADPARRSLARDLYDGVRGLPLVYPHGHVPPKLLADPDATLGTPAELFIIPDHYVFRMLHSQGIPLEEIGVPTRGGTPVETDHRRIWQRFAEAFYLFRGTPSGLWLSTELVEVFGVDEGDPLREGVGEAATRAIVREAVILLMHQSPLSAKEGRVVTDEFMPGDDGARAVLVGGVDVRSPVGLAALARGGRQADAEAQPGHADQETDQRRGGRRRRAAVAELGGGDHDGRPDQGRDGVQLAAQNRRYLAHQDVAHHAAAGRGYQTEQHRLRRSHVKLEGLRRPGYAEQGEARGIEHVQRMVHPLQRGAGEERDEAGCRHRHEVAPIAEGGRRQRPQEHVAYDPANEPDDRG